jgi:transposase InsO family protein
LTIHVHEAEKLSLEQIQAFLNASQEIRFAGETQPQIYHWIEQVLGRQGYHQQSRPARGVLRSYLTKMTGRSRAQVTRLIARYRKSGSLQPAPYRRHRFPQRYTRADIELLATVDAAHENLSGPATRRILEREYRQYGKPEYERLSTISVAHLYNLRQQPRYRERRLSYTRTRPTAVAIGERCCPDPQGQPGYLRVDTVHQGDAPAGQGVYHINAVDQVTQWEIVAATERISEAWLEPVLCALMRQFPFRILGFHSDNGSEFINRVVARLLNKLLIEQTKSRPRHSNDNGLAETKNGAVIRKHMGYGYIPGRARRAPAAVLHRLLQSLSQLPSSVRPSRRHLRRERPPPLPLSPLSDPAGDPVGPAQPGAVPAPRTHPCRVATHRGNPQRHRSRPAHATGETPALRVLAATREGAVEMTEPENPQKQNQGFSASLESAKNKGALSTFPPPRLRLLDWFRIYP